MKTLDIIFRGVILIIGVIVIAFDALLYNFCERQKMALNALSDQQKVESQVNSNRFKYQQGQIEHLSSDLENAQQQIKNQHDDLAGQKDASKSIQASLEDIKAEADAIKQDVKGWQKNYVSVLAEIERKMDDSRDEIKSVKDNLDSLNIPELKESINSLKADIEKITQPADNSLSEGPK